MYPPGMVQPWGPSQQTWFQHPQHYYFPQQHSIPMQPPQPLRGIVPQPPLPPEHTMASITQGTSAQNSGQPGDVEKRGFDSLPNKGFTFSYFLCFD